MADIVGMPVLVATTGTMLIITLPAVIMAPTMFTLAAAMVPVITTDVLPDITTATDIPVLTGTMSVLVGVSRCPGNACIIVTHSGGIASAISPDFFYMVEKMENNKQKRGSHAL